MTGYLLDTHALIWALSEPNKLSIKVSEILSNPGNHIYVSAVNAWEIAIKQKLGKLVFPLEALKENLELANFDELKIAIHHTTFLLQLPNHHRDPFDRLLIAQAMAENLAIISIDPQLKAYTNNITW